jgi:hypothetical protein
MSRRMTVFMILLAVALLFSLPTAAQVVYPGSAEQRKAAEGAKAPPYVAHDISGIWRAAGPSLAPPKDPKIGDAHASVLMGGVQPPPMTPWAQEIFDSRKPSAAEAWQSRRVSPALGNDPLGHCDPLGYPRNLFGPVEIVQTPTEIVQVFDQGRSIREIWTDGRKLPAADELDPRFYGYSTARWEGDSLIVDSFGYDERSWLDGNGWPHSDEMKLHEVFRHPDATTLEITMTIDDPKAYTKPWVGAKQTYHLVLPKEQAVMYEYYCAPSEEDTFNKGVRNPAGGDVKNSRPLQ